MDYVPTSKFLRAALVDEPLIESIFEKSRDLHARLHQSHGNLDAILASMRRWSCEPLHQRSLYGRNLLDLRHQQERVRLRLLQCDETKMLLNRLLIANFCLLFNYERQQLHLYARDLSVHEVSPPCCVNNIIIVTIVYSAVDSLCTNFRMNNVDSSTNI